MIDRRMLPVTSFWNEDQVLELCSGRVIYIHHIANDAAKSPFDSREPNSL
jgi:hypothetical protein